MAQDQPGYSTLALNTKLEESFVSPLTAIRGMLEILRDFPDLDDDKRQHFVESALFECARLERGVDELSISVYAAGERVGGDDEASDEFSYSGRVNAYGGQRIIEIDFSDFEFTNSDTVDAFFDCIDKTASGGSGKWYLLVNFRNCRIWPEAWVAYAHRSRRVHVNYALGTVRYDEGLSSASAQNSSTTPDALEPDMYPSRDAAMKRLLEMLAQAE